MHGVTDVIGGYSEILMLRVPTVLVKKREVNDTIINITIIIIIYTECTKHYENLVFP